MGIYIIIVRRSFTLRYPCRNIHTPETKKYIFGRFIRDPKVICIDNNNDNLGILETSYALQLARDANLDLVIVSYGKRGNLSTCKILDLGKYKYEQDKKNKITKKKQRENAVKIKEVKFRPSTDYNDLLNKANQLNDFLSEGNRLKVTITFRGREMIHKNIGIETLKKFAEMISAHFDIEPSMNGRNMTAILVRNEQKVESI